MTWRGNGFPETAETPGEKWGADLSLGRSKALVPSAYVDLDLLKASFQVTGMNTWGVKDKERGEPF